MAPFPFLCQTSFFPSLGQARKLVNMAFTLTRVVGFSASLLKAGEARGRRIMKVGQVGRRLVFQRHLNKGGLQIMEERKLEVAKLFLYVFQVSFK